MFKSIFKRKKDDNHSFEMFFKNLAHEILTPLTLSMNSIRNALEKFPGADDLKDADAKINNLYRVLNNLFEFKNIFSSKFAIVEPVNLSSFLQSVNGTCSNLMRKKDILYSMDTNGLKDVYVRCRVDIIERILFNFVSNAYKFTHVNGIVKILLTEESDKVRITVSDNGVGVEEEVRKSIFDGVVRHHLEADSEYNQSTLGLGLAVSKKLADEAGVKIGFESTRGKGSSFWMEFSKSESESKVSLKEVLFLDDDSKIRDIYDSLMFTKLPGFDYDVAEDPSIARELLKKNVYKVVVSDAQMPKESGVDFLTYVSEAHPKTARILVTGQANTEMLQSAVNAAKINNVIYKPVEEENMIDLIKKYSKDSELKKSSFDENNYSPPEWHFSDLMVKKEKSSPISKESEEDAPLILVVDDILEMGGYIERALVEFGYNTLHATNGREATDLAKAHKPDLIITDWMMPEMDGIELIEWIRKDVDLKATPVILLTVKTDIESRLISHKAGVNCFLSKPFNRMELDSIVKSLLKLKETERTLKDVNRYLSEDVLKRFLPPKLVDDIVQKKEVLEEEPKINNLTILMMDLCDFTNIAHDLGPKKMATILDEYLKQVSVTAFEFGGIVEKIDNDRVSILFGAPAKMDLEKQISSAYNCSMKILKDFESMKGILDDKAFSDINIRGSIHNGPAIIGSFGGRLYSQYTAIGPTVNIAQGILKEVKPGEVYFSEVVRDLMPVKSWESIGEHEMKDLDRRIILFRALDNRNG